MFGCLTRPLKPPFRAGSDFLAGNEKSEPNTATLQLVRKGAKSAFSANPDT